MTGIKAPGGNYAEEKYLRTLVKVVRYFLFIVLRKAIIINNVSDVDIIIYTYFWGTMG